MESHTFRLHGPASSIDVTFEGDSAAELHQQLRQRLKDGEIVRGEVGRHPTFIDMRHVWAVTYSPPTRPMAI